MAFEIKDFFHDLTKKGDNHGLFNLARADVDNEGLMFVAHMNNEGNYVIQRITTSGTLMISQYYSKIGDPSQFSTDWSGRASLTYVEYYQLFNQ